MRLSMKIVLLALLALTGHCSVQPLAWYPVQGAAGYEIAWQTNTWDWNYVLIGTNTSFVLPVTDGEYFRVAVCATNGPDTSEWFIPQWFQLSWPTAEHVIVSSSAQVTGPYTQFLSIIDTSYTFPMFAPSQFFNVVDVNTNNVPRALKTLP